MTQSSSLTDALTKNASLLNGLLSQMSGNFGASAPGNDGFSSLLSADNGFDAAGVQQTSAQSQLSAPTDTTSSQASVATGSSPLFSSANSTGSTSTLLQNLGDLSQNLQKILAALRQAKNAAQQNSSKSDHQQTAVVSSDRQTSAPTTATTTPSSSASAASTDAASSATTAASDSSASDAKTVPDIIAELLAMVQMMMAALKQSATDAGNAAQATDATQSASVIGQSNTGLLDLMKEFQNLNTTNIAGASTIAGAADQTADSTPANPLLQMLQALEKDVQQLAPGTAASSTPDTAMAALTQSSASSSVLASQFNNLDHALKQVVAGLEQIATQPQTQTAVNAVKQLADAAQNDAQNATAALTASLPQSGAPDATVKSALSDKMQNRLNPLTPASQSASQTPPPAAPTAQPVSATLNAASIAAAARDGATGDTNSNFMSDNNAASGGNTGQNFTSGLSAEGLQAAGTYSFASTLSALRAANGGSTGLPSVVDQVILQMNRSVKNGNDQLSLQLHPADLGKITVKLDVSSDGKVQGTVTADNAHTLSMLQKDSRSLERALQDAGLRADPGSLQFNLGSQQNQSGQATANSNEDGSEAAADGTQNAGDETDAAAIAATAETYYVTPTGVNIRV